MTSLTPEQRGRAAFAALSFSLYLIAADQTVVSGDPAVLFFLVPAMVVAATGQVKGKEAMVRAGLSVLAVVASSLIVNTAAGRGAPDFQSFQVLLSALGGLFAFNLVEIVLTSVLVHTLWTTSDHWTR